jgi:acyl-CoA synthetase (AMP-forming)/AMP-acid ligase II
MCRQVFHERWVILFNELIQERPLRPVPNILAPMRSPSAGILAGQLTCVTHGAATVFPGEGFDAGEVLRAVAHERCTALHGVPTMFIA